MRKFYLPFGLLIIAGLLLGNYGKALADTWYLPIIERPEATSDPVTPEATSAPVTPAPEPTIVPVTPLPTPVPDNPTATPSPSSTPELIPPRVTATGTIPSASPSATPAATNTATPVATVQPMAVCLVPMKMRITYTTARPSLVVNSAIEKNALPVSVPVTDDRVDPPTLEQQLNWMLGPGRWQALLDRFSNPGRIGPFSANCQLEALPGQWDIDAATNSFVKAQPTPTPTPTATKEVWTIDFSNEVGVAAQEEICKKFTNVRAVDGTVVLEEDFAGPASEMYNNEVITERPCLIIAGTYINLAVKGLQGAPQQSFHDLTGKTITCEVIYNNELVGKNVWAEFRIEDSSFRNESLAGFQVVSSSTTFQLVVGEGIAPDDFDSSAVRAIKVENFARDGSAVQIKQGEIFRHKSCVIE